jgi:hypothetical protein
MTMSMYGTYKAMRRDAAAEKRSRRAKPERPARKGFWSVIAMFGIGLDGISCGGDAGGSESPHGGT